MGTRVLLLIGVVAAVVVVAGCGKSSRSGSTATAEPSRCDDPAPDFDATRTVGDHHEVAVHFTCRETVLAGTLYLPKSGGKHPAVVWVHGSGESPRLPYEAAVVAPLVRDGVSVFSYDKRGVGESEGECCENGDVRFDQLAADAAGAVLAVRARSDVDGAHIGFYGASEAGWVVPLANERLDERVAFTALVSGPAVTTGEEEVWSDAAGEDEPGPLTAERKAEATRQLNEAGPSGFDPAPYIERLTTPGLWLLGGGDKSIPADRSAAILTAMKRKGKRFTIIVYPGAGHGLVDTVPTAPAAPGALVRWIASTARP